MKDIRDKVQRLLDAGLVVLGKTKAGYITMERRKNESFFQLLDEIGFFQFHVTNSGWIVGLHQVVAFISYGWKALKNGFIAKKDEIEVHHIDGNISNNKADNLVYLSKQDHVLVSSVSSTPTYGIPKSSVPTPFNRQGKKIQECAHHFLVNIAKETIEAIGNRIGKPLIVGALELISGLPKALYTKVQRAFYIPRVDALLGTHHSM
jgi:hypothetical protein